MGIQHSRRWNRAVQSERERRGKQREVERESRRDQSGEREKWQREEGGEIKEAGVTLEGFSYVAWEYKVSRKKTTQRSLHPKSCVSPSQNDRWESLGIKRGCNTDKGLHVTDGLYSEKKTLYGQYLCSKNQRSSRSSSFMNAYTPYSLKKRNNNLLLCTLCIASVHCLLAPMSYHTWQFLTLFSLDSWHFDCIVSVLRSATI